MTDQGNTQGNPTTVDQNQAEDAVFGSEDFFGQMEKNVNGMVDDGQETQDETEATHSESGSNNVNWDNDGNPYKKRYADSSRESVKLNQELRTLRPFVPVLEAMKKDSGLVEHVRDYLKSGGSPDKSVAQKLKLDEDFVFDGQDAMTDPDSDSAKVLNAHVDGMVQQRVNGMLSKERQNAQMVQKNFLRKKHEAEFKRKNNMSDEEYNSMVEKAKGYTLTLDDVYHLVNKDKAAANVANSTKQDMLQQMNNVRNIPTTASDSNNQGDTQSPTDGLFDTMLDLDGGVDKLFG